MERRCRENEREKTVHATQLEKRKDYPAVDLGRMTSGEETNKREEEGEREGQEKV